MVQRAPAVVASSGVVLFEKVVFSVNLSSVELCEELVPDDSVGSLVASVTVIVHTIAISTNSILCARLTTIVPVSISTRQFQPVFSNDLLNSENVTNIKAGQHYF